MALTKVAVMLEQTTLSNLDELVKQKVFPTRNEAIQLAVETVVTRLQHSEKRKRFVAECAKLDPQEEQAMAEEGMSEVLHEWPEC
jgi:metal-responsive CopG/Arc/MetJ family transcriptional regulator